MARLQLSLSLIILVLAIIVLIFFRRFFQQHKKQSSWLALEAYLKQKQAAVPTEAMRESTETDVIIGDPRLSALGFGKVDTQLENIAQKANFEPQTAGRVMLYVMAPDNYRFTGYELLQNLLAQNLRYGDNNILHRYEYPRGKGKILFSVGPATGPMVMDLNQTGEIRLPGICLFFDLAGNDDPLTSFELMLEAALELAQDLHGQLMDDQHEPLSDEKIQLMRDVLVAQQRSHLDRAQ